MIKVGLIDDNYFLLNDYKEFLEDFSDITVVFTFTSLEELNKNIRHGIFVDEPDVVLLDITIPGQVGIDEVKKLSGIYPSSRVIVMSKYEDKMYVIQSLLSGASGFLPKTAKPMDIYTSIHDVYDSGASLSPKIAKTIIDHLKLRRPIYRKTAAFGHFGRTEDTFSWEATDKAEELRQEAPVAEAAAH